MLNSIGFCLVLALLLVWAVAWFLSKRVRDRDQTKVKLLSNTIIEKENIVKDLESVCVERKNQLNRLIDEGIVCRHQLLQKSNFLRKKSDELYRVQEKLKDVKSQIVYIEKMEENKVLENLKEKSSQNKFSEEIKKMKNIIEKKNKTIAILESSIEQLKDDNYIQISKESPKPAQNKQCSSCNYK